MKKVKIEIVSLRTADSFYSTLNGLLTELQSDPNVEIIDIQYSLKSPYNQNTEDRIEAISLYSALIIYKI